MQQEATGGQKIRPIPIIASFLMAGFIGLFSETALNMALSDLIQVFDISSATVQWLTTGYLLTLGILVPISGLLLQWFTTRGLFFTAVSFSIAGTLIAALSPTFAMLMIGRVVQAVGTALLLPLMFNTILLIFPEHKRGSAMGMIGLVIMFAPAVGPTISGLILENLTWNWIFWISLPFLIIALLFGMKFMQNVSVVTKPKIDILSIILSTLGFGGVVFAFSSAGESGWGSATVLVSIIVGGIALGLFVWRQLTMEKPLMDLKVFKYPMFTLGLILVFISFMMILSTMILLPLYLQNSLALAAFSAGLVLLPGGVLNGLMSPFTGRLFDAYGPRALVIPGFIVAVVALFFLTRIEVGTSALTIIVLHSVLMIGISMVMMPAQTNGLNQLPPKLYPDGTAIMNTLQQVSGAIGTAVAITIMSAGQKAYMETAQGMGPEQMVASLTAGIQNAFVFGLIMACIGLLCSLFIRKAK
ncbi:DHA2 family efflux MFS transporter permease subunit [Listeria monocytogenes]|uniref:DHA2 family efflux MFS transporter permease subunit n=1 Tax=Listeria monocytogenes TaxID=1639 RepID=A0AAN3BDG6_LISMN|nr:DHA2 family efflux MFS transporter permease subunit [Listeria monocytogenes]EAF4507983.1 DHA2 family efflux MFS transporter permease subunit [Listeria monocytogenes serotype 1/2a]EHC6163662.1 multidrug efflux MFS transporter [Listeria monocytogenes serotype 1/2b]EAA0024227.1 lincomycin resistance protein LmrB [Listeria monocytogenes]EAC2635650.1 DHA2 family efflux MFS transporter permease subunit [Listeria monocytogenes]EAC2785731.1 DHA2 family efflux MFS transporter permease subunit [Liste